MEPFVLQPDQRQFGPVGRQEANPGKSWFPQIVHFCHAHGRRAADGWSVVSCAKVVACELLDLKSVDSQCRSLADAWVSDAFEKPVKRPCTGSGIGSVSAPKFGSDQYVRWTTSVTFVFDEPITLTQENLTGKQMHPVQKCSESVQSLLAGRSGVWFSLEDSRTEAGTLPRAWASGYLFRVPAPVALQPSCVVSPASFCNKLRVEPAKAQAEEADADADVPAVSSGSRQKFESKEAFYNRGQGALSDRTPIQDILFAQMAYLLQNARDTGHILDKCARILDPDGSKLQGKQPLVPSHESMRRSLIKLDLFLMLYRRQFHSPDVQDFCIYRFLSSDASPQAHHNYFCTVEDVVKQPRVFRVGDDFNAFKDGFDVERRSLPALTLGKGAASTAHKARLLVHCACLEYGEENLSLWRKQVISFLSDQGTERNLPSFPVNLEGNLAGFMTDFSEQPKAGGCDDPMLLPCSFSIPGLLHIIFNALEEALVQLEEWKPMEKQLQAACQVVAEPSSQSLILERLFGDARNHEKVALASCKSKLLSWRWQSLQMVVQEWFDLYPFLQQRWDPSVFPDPASSHVQTVSGALQSSWHGLFLAWLCMFTSAVGREATWFEGCFCHSDILSSQSTSWARKKAMQEAQCDEGNCVWQGRRLPALALGHCGDLCRRIMNCGGSVFASALMAAEKEEGRRMAEIDVLVKNKFCRLIEQKCGPFESLPYVLVGGFGEYCGYSLSAAKAAVARGISEYEKMKPHERDAVSASMLEHDKSVAQQLKSFARVDCSRPLHDFPDAFLALRARAFSLLTERHTEGEHARIKLHAQRGFRFAGPVVTAARKRRAEVNRMIEENLHWLAQVWNSRSVFPALLHHMLSKNEVNVLTWSEKCKRVYACDMKDHFADMSKWEKEAEAFQKTVKKIQLSLEDAFRKIPEEAMHIVHFLKHFLATGMFVSVPADLWRAAAQPDASQVPVALDLSVLEKCLLQPKLPSADAMGKHMFFSIVDARPELKVVVKLRKTKSVSTLVHVCYYPHVHWKGPREVKINVDAREPVVLDLSAWTFPGSFGAFCANAVAWSAECAHLQLNLNPSFSTSEVPLSLPMFVDDDDALESLCRVDSEGQGAMEHSKLVEETTGVTVEISGRPLSDMERASLMSLIQEKAFSEASACGVFDLPWVQVQALRQFNSLGILDSSSTELGDEQWWIKDVVSIAPGMRLTNATSLLLSVPRNLGVRAGPQKTCRIALVLALLQEGWSCRKWKDSQIWCQFQADEKKMDKIFCSYIWKRPEAYFKAMLLIDHICTKPGNLKKIHHLAPASYYSDLLAAESTSAFKRMTDEECRQYKSKSSAAVKASSQPAGPHPTSGAASSSAAPRGDEPMVLEVPPEGMDLPPVRCRAPKLDTVKVLYDRFTHASGHLRCFTSCVNHAQCRKYTFVRNHASRAEAECWLFAWAALGSKCKSAEEHKAREPSAAEVSKMMRFHALL